MVMPISGCNNNSIETKTIDPIDHSQPGNFVFCIHKDKTHALNTTKNGLHTSLG